MDPNEMTANMSPSGKREGYINKPDYFMAIALLAAKMTKYPNRQVGACIVNQKNCIVGVGYNNNGDGDGENTPSIVNYDYRNVNRNVCHAEWNAIKNKTSDDVKNCTIYVTLFPCDVCADNISKAGITEVVFLSDIKTHKLEYKASKKILEDAGVKYWRLTPHQSKIEIDFVENFGNWKN